MSVNSYLIQDIAKAMVPAKPEREVALWYQYYFQIERGRAGLAANRRGIARILWRQWSPNWQFDEACFERTAAAHDNPDYVDVVIHSYRHRYRSRRRRSANMPTSSAGWRRCRPLRCPPSRWTATGTALRPRPTARAQAAKFTGPRIHRVIPRAGHNLPQEEPEAFAAAVMELIKA